MIAEIMSHGLGVVVMELLMTAMQLLLGAFFAISGYHKLFNKERHTRLVATLSADGVPVVRFMQWWVPLCEFCGGVFLLMGFMTVAAAFVLAVICGVACLVDAPARVAAYGPIDKADALDDWLYLPELLYILMLTLIMAYGPVMLSVDTFIWGK